MGNENKLSIANCIFRNNFATEQGGAVYLGANYSVLGNGEASPLFTNCSFSHNKSLYGGAVSVNPQNGTANPNFRHCDFIENDALDGGAIYVGSYVGGSAQFSIEYGKFLPIQAISDPFRAMEEL